MNSIVISTQCPTCAAPLDFTEGTNAIRCRYCQSNLLVTGRKQVLSYSVAPKIDRPGAEAAVRAAHRTGGRSCRVVNTQLYFIPFYRLTAHDFQWQLVPLKPPKDPMDPSAAPYAVSGDQRTSRETDLLSTFRWVENLLGTIFSIGGESGRAVTTMRPVQKRPDAKTTVSEKISGPEGQPNRLAGRLLHKNEEIVFSDRYVERNFVACQLQGLDVYSLGVRPSVLRLELFHRETLAAAGTIVNPEIGPDVALSQGMRTAGLHPVLYRTVIGRILSVVYFPFWMVGVERRGETLMTVVDAVSGSVIKPDAPSGVCERFDTQPAAAPQTIGFRPLACPNCGWDLPANPDDLIFVCSSCNRAWQIRGSGLYEVLYQVAEQPEAWRAGALKYLPLWVLEAKMGETPAFRFFVPAFRYRRLKFLSALARNLSRRQPAYAVLTGERPPGLHECHYDLEDAILLAQFTHASLTWERQEIARAFRDTKLPITGATLTWFPFKCQGSDLLAPFIETALPQHLLV